MNSVNLTFAMQALKHQPVPGSWLSRSRRSMLGWAFCLGLYLIGSALQAAELPQSNVWYRLTNKALTDLNRALTDTGSGVPQMTNTNDNNIGQFWSFEPVDGGKYRIISRKQPGKALDILPDKSGFQMASKANVSGQFWSLTPYDAGFRLSNDYTGTGISLGIYSDDTNIALLPTDDCCANQEWTLTALPVSSNWMKSLSTLIGAKTLNEITIPGSHDSGTYEIPWGSQAKNQHATIYDQLESGIRYFDIRFGWNWVVNDYAIYHGIALTETTMDTVLNDIKRFMESAGADREIIILDILLDEKTDDNPHGKKDGHSWPYIRDLITSRFQDKLITRANYPNVACPELTCPLPFAGEDDRCIRGDFPVCLTLNQLWSGNGRLLLVDHTTDWDNIDNPDLSDGETIWKFYDIFKSTYYTETVNKNEHWEEGRLENQIAKTCHTRVMGARGIDKRLDILFTQRTPPGIIPRELALWDNPQLKNRIEGSWRKWPLNITAGDFTDGDRLRDSAYPEEKTFPAMSLIKHNDRLKPYMENECPPAPRVKVTLKGSLKARHSEKCLEVASSSQEEGSTVRQWSCNDTRSQKMIFRPVSEEHDVFNIVFEHSEKCLDVGGATANGTALQQRSCNDGISQQFKLKYLGSDTYKLISKHSNKVADVAGVRVEDGISIIQWDDLDADNQQWILHRQSSNDIVWRHNNGQVHYWAMNNSERRGGFDIYEPQSSEWTINGIGDVNGDGTDDIVWRNDNGRVHYWAMKDGERLGGYDIYQPQGSEWTINGVGDVNGDGTDDIVWRNDNGRVHYWAMSNGQRTGGYDIYLPQSSDWEIKDVGDVNGDGTDDLVWQNANGQVNYWAMNNGQRIGDSDIYTPMGSYWSIRGVGDINNDGTDDIVWRGTNGEVEYWAMNNGQRTGSVSIHDSVSDDWTIVGVGDVGDVKSTDL